MDIEWNVQSVFWHITFVNLNLGLNETSKYNPLRLVTEDCITASCSLFHYIFIFLFICMCIYIIDVPCHPLKKLGLCSIYSGHLFSCPLDSHSENSCNIGRELPRIYEEAKLALHGLEDCFWKVLCIYLYVVFIGDPYIPNMFVIKLLSQSIVDKCQSSIYG